MYWMITNRNVKKDALGDEAANLSFWTNASGELADFTNWTRLTKSAFQRALVSVADEFPRQPSVDDQKHVTFFVHGYNETWSDAAALYGTVVENLFSGPQSLGECVLYNWPSEGSPLGYLPDRAAARGSAEGFAGVLSDLYDWMANKQAEGAADITKGCKAKTSLIAHSMGNYLVEDAMNFAWTRKNRPLLMSLINQFLMVAADVDNDIFRSGETVQHGDGEGIANLSYRVTALYSGRDSVLGMSAGLKHFGKRRLGRSGLDGTCPVPDNVWDIDCSMLIDAQIDGMAVHSAYFRQVACNKLMRGLLRGIDRKVILADGLTPAPQAA